MKKPVMLMILDGWGYSPSTENNAVYSAKTPNLDSYLEKYPNTLIKCSGHDVGLPEGYMGNSEVGHLNIGAGRVVYQDLSRIDKAIRDNEFESNKVLVQAFESAERNNSRLHLLGLLSDGGVHSHINHLEALVKMAANRGFKDLIVHPVFDGRDTAPMIGEKYLERLLKIFKENGVGSIGSMFGRFYAMDRDTRWDRVSKAYNALVTGKPFRKVDPIEYIKENHSNNKGDEFIDPVCINPDNVLRSGDAFICFNFRADRVREITRALMRKDFEGFRRDSFPELSYYVCMTEYDESFDLPVAFPSDDMSNIFGEVISEKGLKQLRIAETEKYAHVTFFFNGGNEKSFEGEDRILIESPRDVATYDLKPEMSAEKVTERVIKEIDRDYYDVIILNFANCDMVGHTGIFDAAVKAVETVDRCSAKIIEKVLEKDGMVFVTADHGNAEKMYENGAPHTAHTTNPVYFVIIGNNIKKGDIKLKEGRLADIMPTMLQYLDIKKPEEVTGGSLVG